MKTRLTAGFDKLKQAFPNLAVGSEYEKRLSQGLINIIYLMKNNKLPEKDIQDGFRVCGQHREIEDDFVAPEGQDTMNGMIYGTIDASNIGNQCFTEFSDAETKETIQKDSKDEGAEAIGTTAREIEKRRGKESKAARESCSKR